MKIGLTGPIGSGKSTVAAVWESLGAAIVEGDVMGRRALEEDEELQKQIIERFGEQVFNPQGKVLRHILSRLAFANQDAQRDLTRLTFPSLYRLATREIESRLQTHPIVVFDAALIYEWEVQEDFDCIVVVNAPRRKLLRQAMDHLNITAEQARRRLSYQIDPERKKEAADYTIPNEGEIDDLREKARTVWERIIAGEHKNGVE